MDKFVYLFIVLHCIGLHGFVVLEESLAVPARRQNVFNPNPGNLLQNLTNSQCPHLFTLNSKTGTCYLAVRIRATWPEALAYCEAYSSELAIIKSQEEQTFLENYLTANTGSYHHHRDFWLGGADVMSEGDWIWAVSLEKVTYTHWQSGAPDNSHGTQHCLEMKQSSSYEWNDEHCDDHNYFVCETIE